MTHRARPGSSCDASSERYALPKEIYLAADALSGAERAAYVDQACGADAALRAEVEALLDSERDLSSFLQRPILFDDREAAPPQLLERIGAYRILGLLGRGGTSLVDRARQKNPRRVVALKIPALNGGIELERFALEAEVLGRLSHPGIVPIHEAGSADTELGRIPYLAMELVEGVDPIRHAERNGLDGHLERRGRRENVRWNCYPPLISRWKLNS